MPSIRFAPAAQSDLQAIWNYADATWATAQAERYINGIRDAIEQLAGNPTTGRTMDEVGSGYRKRSVGSHFIVFRQAGDGIVVVRILHQRMDPKRHM